MAKKKIDEPLFLQFINLPIFKRTYENFPPLMKDDLLKYEKYIRSLFNQLIKEGNLPSYHASRLSTVLEAFDDRRYNVEYIESICKIWYRFRRFIEVLNSPKKERSWYLKYHYVGDFALEAHATIYWDDSGRFKIGLDTGDEYIEQINDYIPTFEIVQFLSAEFAQFLVDHYKQGIFAYCGFDDCNRYIITANGRKYCCESHKQAAYIKKCKEDKLKREYRKIRIRLYRQYKRHPFLENKMSLEEFLLQNWPTEKLDLYHSFSRPPKK